MVYDKYVRLFVVRKKEYDLSGVEGTLPGGFYTHGLHQSAGLK